MELQAKKGKGIDGLLAGMNPGQVEEQRILPIRAGKYDALLQKYCRLLSARNGLYEGRGMREVKEKIDAHIFDILTPNDIGEFLQLSVQYEEDEDYYLLLPYFMDRLIQNSYDQGHNGFEINTTIFSKQEPIPWAYFGVFSKAQRSGRSGFESKVI